MAGDPNLVAAQDSARAAWSAANAAWSGARWAEGAFWVALLSVGVNSWLAWLAFSGPRQQREADQKLLAINLNHEAAKVSNLQLGALKVCESVFLAADEMKAAATNVSLESLSALKAQRSNLEMRNRLLDYFLLKDIDDAAIVHALLKSKDAASHLLGVASSPALLGGGTAQGFTDILGVVDHVLAECSEERTAIRKWIKHRSAFLDQVQFEETDIMSILQEGKD